MDAILASKEKSEELYALTNCGRKLETQFYYDEFGNVWPRQRVAQLTKRTLPKQFTPAYDMGFMWWLGRNKIKDQERIKSKLKTALYLGADDLCEFLIQMKKQNRFKK
jgi:hypothetical protein